MNEEKLYEALSDRGLMFKHAIIRLVCFGAVASMNIAAAYLQNPDYFENASVVGRIVIFTIVLGIYVSEPFWHWQDRMICYPQKIELNGKAVSFTDTAELKVDKSFSKIWLRDRKVLLSDGKTLNVTYIKNPEDAIILSYNMEAVSLDSIQPIAELLKRIVPEGESYIPIYAYREHRGGTYSPVSYTHYALGVLNDRIYAAKFWITPRRISIIDWRVFKKDEMGLVVPNTLPGMKFIDFYDKKNNYIMRDLYVKDKVIKRGLLHIDQSVYADAFWTQMKAWFEEMRAVRLAQENSSGNRKKLTFDMHVESEKF